METQRESQTQVKYIQFSEQKANKSLVSCEVMKPVETNIIPFKVTCKYIIIHKVSIPLRDFEALTTLIHHFKES